MARPILELMQVVKRYGDFPALRGIDLVVDEGELFGLLGPNGAGKTTLLSIIAGLNDPTSGSVKLAGEPFTSRSRDRRSLIGLATQDLAIYPDLTARENLQFFGRIYGLCGKDLSRRVDEMLAAVALADRADQRAGTFSGGMKRRLNLAIAVIHGPKLLLLDEPTTGVDPQSRNHIFEQVKALNQAGLTVIYTSHYMEEVQTLCPRLAIVDAGVVEACDTLPSLLARLPAVAEWTIPNCPADIPTIIAHYPGVDRCVIEGDRLHIEGPNLAPILPKCAGLLAERHLEPVSLTIDQPNLERVFLTLTGRALRD